MGAHEENYKKRKVVDTGVEKIISLKSCFYRISHFPETGILPPDIIQYKIRLLSPIIIAIDVLISITA